MYQKYPGMWVAAVCVEVKVSCRRLWLVGNELTLKGGAARGTMILKPLNAWIGIFFVTDTVAAKSQIFVNSGPLGWLRMLRIMCHFYSNLGIPSFSSAVLPYWFGWFWCGGRIFASAYSFMKSCHWKVELLGEANPLVMPGCLFILVGSPKVWYGIITLLSPVHMT